MTAFQLIGGASNPLEHLSWACPGAVQLPRLPSWDHSEVLKLGPRLNIWEEGGGAGGSGSGV